MDSRIESRTARRKYWTTKDVSKRVQNAKVVVFCKGDSQNPRCGYSERAIAVAESMSNEFEVVDVLENPSIMPALAMFSGERRLPQLYVNGKLVADSSNFSEKKQEFALASNA